MKSPYQFIIEPLNDKLYNSTKKIGDVDLIISTSFENHKTTNRQAIVKEVPLSYSGPIQKGAIIVVHHNTFRKYLDIRGKEQFSSSKIDGSSYMILEDVIYAYKNDWSQDWEPVEPYCFVKPVDNDADVKMTTNKELYGIMVYSNSILVDQDINNGDKVVFSPDSEYEFDLDDTIMYRINYNDICLKV